MLANKAEEGNQAIILRNVYVKSSNTSKGGSKTPNSFGHKGLNLDIIICDFWGL